MSDEMSKTEDGYLYGAIKLNGVTLDGYYGSVINPLNRLFTGRFSTNSKALQWCRHIIARDRKDPWAPYRK